MKYVQILILFLLPAFIACNQGGNTEGSTAENSTTNSTPAQEVISERMLPDDFMRKYDASSGAVLLDVRTPEEYAEGYIPGAQNINFYDENFKTNASSQLDKSKPVFIYCAAGGRSAKAAIALEKAGFTEIYDMEGGYGIWSKMEEERANQLQK